MVNPSNIDNTNSPSQVNQSDKCETVIDKSIVVHHRSDSKKHHKDMKTVKQKNGHSNEDSPSRQPLIKTNKSH